MTPACERRKNEPKRRSRGRDRLDARRRRDLGTASMRLLIAFLVGATGFAPPATTRRRLRADATTSSGIEYEDIQVGSGPSPNKGDFVSVTYETRLKGRVIDAQGGGSRTAMSVGVAGAGDGPRGRMPSRCVFFWAQRAARSPCTPRMRRGYSVEKRRGDAAGVVARRVLSRGGFVSLSCVSLPIHVVAAASTRQRPVPTRRFAGDKPWAQFAVGKGLVIPGWDETIQTMQPGGRRKVKLPAALAYGDAGSPDGVVLRPSGDLVRRSRLCYGLREDDASIPTLQKPSNTAFASPDSGRRIYFRRGDISPMNRGGAAAATWIFRGERRPAATMRKFRSRPARASGTAGQRPRVHDRARLRRLAGGPHRRSGRDLRAPRRRDHGQRPRAHVHGTRAPGVPRGDRLI